MIPKSQLSGREAEFRRFIEQKTGMTFHRKRAPINRLRDWIRRRENESYHL